MTEVQLWIIIFLLTLIFFILLAYCITSIILKVNANRSTHETDELIKKILKEESE